MPLSQIAFAPRVRKSPFYEATLRHGAKAFTVYNHMAMPLWFEGPLAEYWRLVEHVTMWDVAAERQVEIEGPDAARLTQMLTPRDLSNLEPGQCRYVLITDENGGVMNDPVLLKLSETKFWLSLADSDVLLFAKGVAAAGGYDVAIREPDVSPMQVQGPKAVDVMADLFGEWVADLRYFRFRETELGGIPVVVSRTGWSSERGYEIFLRDGSRGSELWDKVAEAGKPYDIGPAAPNQIRRMEGGMVSWGTDCTLENNPYELDLGRLVKLDGGFDFVGKAALTRIAQEGVKRRMVGLSLDGTPMTGSNEDFWPVSAGAQRVGHVTSAVYSPRLEVNMAMAFVDLPHDAIGTRLSVETDHGRRTASVVELPFWDPEKAITRST